MNVRTTLVLEISTPHSSSILYKLDNTVYYKHSTAYLYIGEYLFSIQLLSKGKILTWL
jgi:hypothetical protein